MARLKLNEFLIFTWLTFASHALIANATQSAGEVLIDKDPVAFKQLYMGAGWATVNPTSFSERYYSRGVGHPTISYRYFLKDSWTMGLHGGFKLFYDFEGKEIPIFALSQESTKLIRVMHPFWIGVGARLLYLVQVEGVTFPIRREREVPSQIGVGANLDFYYLASERLFWNASLQRWRSTAHQRLHVIEFSLGLAYAIY